MSKQPTELYKICQLGHAKLAIMPKPDSDNLGEAMLFYKQQGIAKIVSLLLAEEAVKLNLEDEAAECEKQGMEFLNFAIKDMAVPELAELKALNKQLQADLLTGKSVAIHCHGGRGRAGTVATTLMIEHGYEAEQAMQIASQARGDQVPVNELQRNFVLSYA